MLEAVIRHQIAHCSTEPIQMTYLLSYGDHDASDALIERFRGGPTVKKTSEMSISQEGALIVRLDVDAIRWRNSRVAIVTATCATYTEAFTSVYTLRLKNGKWVVTHSRVIGAS